MTKFDQTSLNRRVFLGNTILAIGAALGLTQCSKPNQTAKQVTFIGQPLTQPAQRIVLAQSRFLQTLRLVDKDIVNKLVGWSQDLKRLYPAEYKQWLQIHPHLDQLAVVGDSMAQTISIEKILALKPDLVIFSRSNIGTAQSDSSNGDFKILTKAGIAILVVDFFTHPIANTIPSIKALADVLGQHSQSNKFIQLYESKIQLIKTRLQQHNPKLPRVFIHAHAGSAECCYSTGSGVFNDFVTTAGGLNVATDLISTPTGQINKEYIFSLQPDYYLASGVNSPQSVGKLKIGPGISASIARESLQRVIKDSGFAQLTAVTNKNAYGFFHAFNDSIAHIAFLEALAKWFHPQIFTDLNPEQTLQQLNEQFLTPPLTGTFWIQA